MQRKETALAQRTDGHWDRQRWDAIFKRRIAEEAATGSSNCPLLRDMLARNSEAMNREAAINKIELQDQNACSQVPADDEEACNPQDQLDPTYGSDEVTVPISSSSPAPVAASSARATVDKPPSPPNSCSEDPDRCESSSVEQMRSQDAIQYGMACHHAWLAAKEERTKAAMIQETPLEGGETHQCLFPSSSIFVCLSQVLQKCSKSI